MERSTVVQDISEQITCGICLERFKTPKTVIPCLHNFCEKCLQNTIEQLAHPTVEDSDSEVTIFSFECPSCRTPIEFIVKEEQSPWNMGRISEEAVKTEFKTNFQIENQLEIIKKKIEKGCPKHQGEIQMWFCKLCVKIICQFCVQEDHLPPKHEVTLYGGFLKEKRSKLENHKEAVSIAIDKRKSACKKIESQLENIHDAKSKYQNRTQNITDRIVQVCKQFEIVKDGLLQQNRDLDRQMDSIEMMMMRLYQNMLQDIDDYQSDIKDLDNKLAETDSELLQDSTIDDITTEKISDPPLVPKLEIPESKNLPLDLLQHDLKDLECIVKKIGDHLEVDINTGKEELEFHDAKSEVDENEVSSDDSKQVQDEHSQVDRLKKQQEKELLAEFAIKGDDQVNKHGVPAYAIYEQSDLIQPESKVKPDASTATLNQVSQSTLQPYLPGQVRQGYPQQQNMMQSMNQQQMFSPLQQTYSQPLYPQSSFAPIQNNIRGYTYTSPSAPYNQPGSRYASQTSFSPGFRMPVSQYATNPHLERFPPGGYQMPTYTPPNQPPGMAPYVQQYTQQPSSSYFHGLSQGPPNQLQQQPPTMTIRPTSVSSPSNQLQQQPPTMTIRPTSVSSPSNQLQQQPPTMTITSVSSSAPLQNPMMAAATPKQPLLLNQTGISPPKKLESQSKDPRECQAPVDDKEPLTANILSRYSPDVQKQLIGERLYPEVHKMHSDLAGKITGMLLEKSNAELLKMLECRDQLIYQHCQAPVDDKEPLTAKILSRYCQDEQKQIIGERLYPRVYKRHGDLAGKITGMLLEMSNAELLKILECRDQFINHVASCVETLKNFQMKNKS